MQTKAALVVDAGNIVGESVVWDDRTSMLYWVDIIGRKIFAWQQGKTAQSWAMEEIVTSIGLCTDSRVILGLAKQVALWDFHAPPVPLVAIEPDQPQTRLNEGVVGPDGCFWVGTMQNNIAADGSPMEITAAMGRLYRVHPDGRVDSLSDDRFGITNTLVWTDDGQLITADTLENALYAYCITPAGLTDRRTVLKGFPRGLPDGSCRDAEGFIWNCRVVGGGCVIRIAPDGRVDKVIELPCSWPTSCAFGGPALDQLFVTSARFTMSPQLLAANPQEGGVFCVDTGHRGALPHRFLSKPPFSTNCKTGGPQIRHTRQKSVST